MEDIFKSFGEYIKCRRTKLKMSRRQLAEKAGFTDRAIEYWEKDMRSISLDNADKILRALNSSLRIGAEPKK